MAKTRSRKQKRARRLAGQYADLKREIENLESERVKIGMSWDESVQLICDAARELRHTLTVEGVATKAPWGLTFDPRVLEATIGTGVKHFRLAVAELSNPRNLNEDDSARVYFQLIEGAMTLGAGALLYLQSQPLSYELARYVTAGEDPGS